MFFRLRNSFSSIVSKSEFYLNYKSVNYTNGTFCGKWLSGKMRLNERDNEYRVFLGLVSIGRFNHSVFLKINSLQLLFQSCFVNGFFYLFYLFRRAIFPKFSKVAT